MNKQADELAIYIHWPFCKSKCPYCDFYKEVNPTLNQNELINEYLAALKKYNELLPKRSIKSIFFGGGTPSLIKPQNIEKIITQIYKLWPIKDNIEISLEANPNSHHKTLFSDFKNAGINRLSLGVQALNDNDLHFLGRTHNLKSALNCLEEITKIYSNHSADLIYARPQQKIGPWLEELNKLISYNLAHISLYQLTIEPNTVFARRNIKPLDEEAAADMYNETRNFLTANGYNHYEVSNFAKPDKISIHNLTYWQGGDYIGIGKSAHGRLKIKNQHFSTVYPFIHEKISPQERAEELIIMGLRLTDGINKQTFSDICHLDIKECINPEKFEFLKSLQLLSESDTHIYPTYQGMLFIDKITTELCT